MRAWTTPAQRAWLRQQIPKYLNRQGEKGEAFATTTTAAFLQEFPDASTEGLRAVSFLCFRTAHNSY